MVIFYSPQISLTRVTMHFKPEINFCVVFILKCQHREIRRGENNLRKFSFLLLLEEKITAAAESRWAGCSLFARFSLSTVGLERSEKTTASLPTRFRSRCNESSNRNQYIYKMPNKTRQKLYFATILDLDHQQTPLTIRWVAVFWKRTFRVVLRKVLWIPIASHCEAGRGYSKWAK